MCSPDNTSHVLLSHEYILYMPRLGLIPVFPSSEFPSFSSHPLMGKYSLVELRMVIPYDTIEGQYVVTGN